MTQNRSSAVMAQRIEPNDSLDDFPTQPWGTRALCEHILDIRGSIVWEPAANRGYMVRPLREYALKVFASDVHDYGRGFPVHDFLWPVDLANCDSVDWVISNPPFRLAKEFILRGLQKAGTGVAVLVRSSFKEGVDRYNTLFRDRPPSYEGVFVERLPLVKGRVDPEASTATAYCWLVWYRAPPFGGCRTIWIPPCRKRLERPGDYE